MVINQRSILLFYIFFICSITLALVAQSAEVVPTLLDPRTTELPVYWLSAKAKVDGNLRKWKGVPPSVLPENFKIGETKNMLKPDDDFAPSVFLGMPRGSQDLFILVLMRDGYCLPLESSAWVFGDCLEVFLDYGREKRDKEDPEWWKEPGKWNRATNAQEMSQFGFLPEAPGKPAQAMSSPATRKSWKVDYASVPVRGGYVYEMRVDAASVLADVKLADLPKVIGFDLMIRGTDYPIVLDGAGWNNHRGYVRLFGDYSVTSRPVSYGGISLIPREPKGDALPGRSLEDIYGKALTRRDLSSVINRRDPEAVAELLYWQLWNGMVPEKESLERIVAEPWPKAREVALLAMLDAYQDEDTRRAVAAAAFKAKVPDTPRSLVAACLLHKAFGKGQSEELKKLLAHDNMTVVVAAASALASTGTSEDYTSFIELYQQMADKAANTPLAAAMKIFVKPSLDEMQFRFDPPPLPKAQPVREIVASNTDLPRFLPADNNTVYNGTRLLREWPEKGPRELWRQEIGKGFAVVTEAGGRAYAMGSAEGKTWGYCFNAADGKLLWRKELLPNVEGYSGATPVLDGTERVYYSMSGALVCLRAEDGEQVWRENKEFSGASFSTPLLVDDLLVVPGKRLAAVDKLTGKVRWRIDTPGASPASPALQELDGIRQIIIGVGSAPSAEVWGVSLTDGEIFWTFQLRNGYGLCPSPVVHGSRVLLSCGETGMEHYTSMQMFVKDGKIRAIPALVRTDVQTSYANTMAVWNGAVYGYGGGSLECINADTGTVYWHAPDRWKNDLQVIIADGLAFVQNDDELVLAEATTAAYRELGRVKLPVTPSRQQPTIANGRLYVRGESWIICYQVGEE